MGGNTEFADARAAFEDLDDDDDDDKGLKEQLIREDYVAAHSLWWSRKRAAPGKFEDMEPRRFPFGRHRLVQRHEASGRMNLYVASHVSWCIPFLFILLA